MSTPTLLGSFTIHQLFPNTPIYIIGPEPQNRYIAQIEEGTMEDARLLAAAPELLNLCEKSLLALHEDDFPSLREALRNAITKATQP